MSQNNLSISSAIYSLKLPGSAASSAVSTPITIHSASSTPLSFDGCNGRPSCEFSALAMFQSVVYGNNCLALQEQNELSLIPSSSAPVPSSLPAFDDNSSALKAIVHPYKADTKNQNNSNVEINICPHVSVTKINKKTKSGTGTIEIISCNMCDKQLYNYNPSSNILKKDDKWYSTVYLKCNHPDKYLNKTTCKKCGKIVNFILK